MRMWIYLGAGDITQRITDLEESGAFQAETRVKTQGLPAPEALLWGFLKDPNHPPEVLTWPG